MALFTGTLGDLLDLVLPSGCAGCGDPGPALCAHCRPHGAPLSVRADGVPVVAAGAYAGGLRAALIAYKERGRRQLAGPLAHELARAVTALVAAHGPVPPAGTAVVPVPSTRAAARARGGDHLLRLSRPAAGPCALPVVRALRLRRAVLDSAGLGAAARRANLADAMRAVAPRRGGPGTAVIVDDIVTTGASMAEAARALGASGWLVIGGAVVAATPRTINL